MSRPYRVPPYAPFHPGRRVPAGRLPWAGRYITPRWGFPHPGAAHTGIPSTSAIVQRQERNIPCGSKLPQPKREHAPASSPDRASDRHNWQQKCGEKVFCRHLQPKSRKATQTGRKDIWRQQASAALSPVYFPPGWLLVYHAPLGLLAASRFKSNLSSHHKTSHITEKFI